MQDIYIRAEALRRCQLVFHNLGDEAGVDACLRALAALAARPEQAGRASDERGGPSTLTARERQVASLVASGLSNREISRAIGVAEGTARRHVANILGKLDFNSRAQIAGWVVVQRRTETERQA